jgi:Zn-finger nucleic acid-binding protein
MYNDAMNCPNDNAEMHQVKILTTYGQPLFLDQCDKCGGIWFDQMELYRAKQGEAEKIESLDTEILIAPSQVENSIYNCPRDGTKLFRFTDKYFPENIIVERCPKCDGFWLNRGEFTKYQKARQELLRPKEKTPEDKKLEEDIEIILSNHQAERSNDVLTRLGNFLSTPIDGNTVLPLNSTEKSSEVENTLSTILNVLTTLLRLFVFR